MPASYSNQPLATIDLSALKSNRFLFERPGRRPALAYRDAEGRVNVHLCMASEKELARLLGQREDVPQDVQDKLKTWTKHARTWQKSDGPTWKREVKMRGAEWVSSTGQRLKELSQLEAKADESAAVPLQESTEASSRVASRVGGTEAERRRQAMADIAAGRGGRKRPAEGDGGASSSPGPTPMGTGVDVKRSRGEAHGGEAREARERKQAEKAARRAEKEQEETARQERKAAKVAKRAAKAARREARESGAQVSGAEEEEEEEANDESEEESEAEDQDDSEQVFEDTMAKCDKVATKMRLALSALVRPGGAAKGGKEVGMEQPANMTSQMTMAPHQLVGLSWLHGLHQQKASGILADEMGLGKTVQAIALLAQLLSEGDKGPHLVVAPTSTLTNWQREFEMWCPALKVLKYHGSEAERAEQRAELLGGGGSFHVVLCTFKLWEQDSDKARAERGLFKKLKLSYLVLDEAQQIKNSESRRYKNLTAVRSSHRLLLTGTPIENSPRELLSLLAFLMPSTFAASTKDGKKGMKDALVQLFATLERAGEGQDVTAARASRIKKLMAPFMLRRLKEVVLHGLLPKSEEDMLVPMTPPQQQLYADTVTSIASQALERQRAWEAEGGEGGEGGEGAPARRGGQAQGGGLSAGVQKKWVVAAFTELRKVAQHPMLVRSHYRDIEKIAYVLKCEEEFGAQATLEMVRQELNDSNDLALHLYCGRYAALRSLRMPPEALLTGGKSAMLAELLPPLLADGHRVLIFSQWTSTLDTLALLLDHLGISSVRFDGSTPAPERQRLIDAFNADATIGVFLLTTRAGGLGINLTAADTVIIHDVDFNPAADKQAMDRAHRMGQLRPVRVIKLASAKTVDEQVLEIAARSQRATPRTPPPAPPACSPMPAALRAQPAAPW